MPSTGACHRACLHRELVENYRSARTAWEQLRESDSPAYGAAGAANSGAAVHQLSDSEFRQLHPPPTFKAWLLAMRRTREC